MEELFLCSLFRRNELNVVDQQNIVISVSLAEAQELVVPNGADEIVGELFRGDVGQPQTAVSSFDLLADGVHEVGLAETHSSIHKQRVVGLRGSFCDRKGRSVRELIGGTDDKRLERVLG